jgi:hypothetical protein
VTKNQKEIKALEEEIEHHKHTVRLRNDRIVELTQENNNRGWEINRLSCRLDACLFSMVLMQNQLRQAQLKIEFLERNNKEVSLAT